MEERKIVKIVYNNQIATTPTSILIESLLKKLCTLIESNDENASKLYNFICNKLFDVKLIDASYKLTEFEGLRSQYQNILGYLIMAAHSGEKCINIQQILSHLKMSHYQRDFEELAYIAGGGFGKVFLVRHNLNGIEYAVKKVIIRANRIKSVMTYLDEVKIFASLNHPNVVQYKAAWLEFEFHKHSAIEQQTDSGTSSTDQTSQFSSSKDTKKSNFPMKFNTYPPKQHSYSNKYISNKKSNRKSCCIISNGGNIICPTKFEQQKLHNQWATLFIQMSLCPATLKQWIEKRNQANNFALNSRREQVVEIFHQILEGLNYIHEKGIIHHDIKPSNIFVQCNLNKISVQIGDFGLACPLQRTSHSLPFGSKLYAAPEQLIGSCDPKSDMYSSGIVLFEMIGSFHTDMEKVEHISNLRNGTMFAEINAQEPHLAHIVSQLVWTDPINRPNASEVLKKLHTKIECNFAVKALKSQIFEREKEIQRLKSLLEKAGIKY